MTRKDLESDIIAIANGIRVGSRLIDQGDAHLALTGRELAFTSIDMVYLYLEVRSRFRIELDATDLDEYRFNSIDSITDIIAGKLGIVAG